MLVEKNLRLRYLIGIALLLANLLCLTFVNANEYTSIVASYDILKEQHYWIIQRLKDVASDDADVEQKLKSLLKDVEDYISAEDSITEENFSSIMEKAFITTVYFSKNKDIRTIIMNAFSDEIEYYFSTKKVPPNLYPLWESVKASFFAVASDVAIIGIPEVGEELTGTYHFSYPDSDVSTYRWYRSDTPDSVGEIIPDAEDVVYTLTPEDIGKYIRFEVTPWKRGYTTSGLKVISEPTPVIGCGKNYVPAVNDNPVWIKDYRFYGGDREIDSLNGYNSVILEMDLCNHSTTSKQVYLVVVVYNFNNQTKNIRVLPLDVPITGLLVNEEIALPDDSGQYNIKIFIWDNLYGNPITKYAIFPSNEQR